MRLRLRESLSLFAKRFGHLAKGWGNPLYLYTERIDQGIKLPSLEEWPTYIRRRLLASTQLITTRPDVLLALSEESRRRVLSCLAQGNLS